MAASDAKWPPIKNARWRVTFPVLDADGDLVTAAGALDSEISKDGGTYADCSNEATEIATASGTYYLDLNATEMNADTVSIIVKSTGGKTTPIVAYPTSGNFNTIVSDIAVVEAAIDSDSVLYLADHDKTQSDIALLQVDTTTIISDLVVNQALINADHDKTQSDIVLISDKLDSDAVLADADHNKTQSDIADLSTKQDSDMVVVAAATDKITSDQVVDVNAITAKLDSDAVLADADHDKTQSDVALLSTKQDSDMVVLNTSHTKTQSDVTLVDTNVAALSTKVDSDAVLADADHDKTQSDIALIDVNAIADQVWEETLADHLGAGTTGNALNAAGAAGDPWATAIPGAYGAGTAGLLLGTTIPSDIAEIYSDTTRIDSDMIVLTADVAAVSTKIDSDAVLADADHDKTQSDVALISGGGLTALASGTAQVSTSSTIVLAASSTFADDEMSGNVVKILSGTGAGQSRVISAYVGSTDTATVVPVWVTTPSTDSVYEIVEGSVNLEAVGWIGQTSGDIVGKINSDASLADADHDKTQSDIALISTKLDSDAVLADADHDKTQSDVALISTKLDSDAVINTSDLVKVTSDVALLQVDTTTIISDLVVNQALIDADHDKTQSDVALLSTKVDSDSTLYLADHDKTQSDIALVYSDTTIMAGTAGVQLGTGQAAAWASALEASAGQIIECIVDTVTNTHTPTTTEFDSDTITEATADHFIGRVVIFTSGALLNQATDITDYAAVGGIGRFTVTAMTDAPANDDTFIIV